jgi:hypothetical protein
MQEIVQTSFDYGVLDEETRVFVKVKAEAIQARLKRTAEDIDMKERSARNFMSVAKRFGSKSAKFADFSISVLYELASPSTPDEIVEGVLSGEISAESKAIREAREAQRRAEEAERKAESFEQQFLWSQKEAELVKSERDALQHKLDTLPPPEVQYVEVPTDPADVQARMQQLEERNRKISEWHKKAVEERDKEKQHAKNAAERASYHLHESNKYRVEMINARFGHDNALKEEQAYIERIHKSFCHSVEMVDHAIKQALGTWPTPIDAQHFEGRHWSLLGYAKQQAKQWLEEIEKLERRAESRIVDAAPKQFIEMSQVQTSWLIYHGEVYSVRDCPVEIFKSVVQLNGYSIPEHWADKKVPELLELPELDLYNRWYLLCALGEERRALSLYESKEDAEEAALTV